MIQRMFVTIDTKKTNYKNVGKINHGDDLILELTVLSDGDMISFNNPMVDLLVKKSDGKMIRQNSGIEHIRPNKFIIEVSKDCVTSPGLSTNQLIINDNGRISTCMFYYTILSSLEEDIIESVSNVEVLEQLDEFTIQMKDKMENFDSELQNRMSELEDAINDLVESFGATSVELQEAELSRNEAEQTRAQAESVRVQNESRRLQNDLDLANAEAERIRAENIRIQNEADRALVDDVMDQKESEREDSELERIQNESKRATNESVRKQNENTRQSNESIRMSNETDRKTQENRRVTAETNRVNAETTRRNNENSRISNEIERQKAMNEMKSLIYDANGFDERVCVVENEIVEINSSLETIATNHLSISVKDFGATGDGVTDDTEAIQRAFNSVSSNHTTILFPKGTYKVTNTLVIKDTDFLTITGDATIIGECYRIFHIQNCNHLTISELNIEGNSYCNKGLSIYDSKYSNVFNVKVQNMGSTTNDNIGGIELIGDCSFSTIRNCKVFNMISSRVAFGIMLSSRENTFSKHCLIDNCLIDTVVPSDDADGIKFLQLGMQSYSTVSNCTILNCDKRAIKVQTEFVDIYNCYCEGKMGYAGIDFQCGNGTATNCVLKFTEQYYIGVSICGANATLKNIKILNDNYDGGELMSAGIRIQSLYSSLEDSLGDIIIDNVYCNNSKRAIIWGADGIKYAKSLKILNMTLENIHDSYLFHFNNAEVDFFQLENLTLLNIPNKVTLVAFSLIFNNCIIRNNNILGQRILAEDHPVRNKNVIYLEQIGGSYYISYSQQETHRKYRFNKNPMNVTGSNGKCFNNSFIGDICENTNPTVITSGDTSYIITNWVCTSPSDETNARGVWKEIKQYI